MDLVRKTTKPSLTEPPLPLLLVFMSSETAVKEKLKVASPQGRAATAAAEDPCPPPHLWCASSHQLFL